ncbi:MAG: hypothetical protein NVSMB2_23470 [Chloroflexota bacterium]
MRHPVKSSSPPSPSAFLKLAAAIRGLRLTRGAWLIRGAPHADLSGRRGAAETPALTPGAADVRAADRCGDRASIRIPQLHDRKRVVCRKVRHHNSWVAARNV